MTAPFLETFERNGTLETRKTSPRPSFLETFERNRTRETRKTSRRSSWGRVAGGVAID